MREIIEQSVKELMDLFPKSFINSLDELILDPKSNLYFRLDNIETIEELQYKVIEWCSRAACKSMPYKQTWRNEVYHEKIRDRINEFLGVDFAEDDWLLIYTYLGNNINRPLCVKFLESEYDLEVIKEYERQKYPDKKRGTHGDES